LRLGQRIAKGRRQPRFADADGGVSGAKVVVVGEASMVGEKLGKDILKLGLPVIAILSGPTACGKRSRQLRPYAVQLLPERAGAFHQG
jgi:hypothetical protein